jgi:heptosyltransferase III
MLRPDNILIYRLGSLGDTVMALPCFHLVRSHYPDSRIVILTNEPVSGKAAPAMAILENSGLCDEAVSYPVGTRSRAELAKVRRAIREVSPEVLVNIAAGRGWSKSLRDYLFFRSCGVRRIIGTPWRKRDSEVRTIQGGEYESESQRLLARLSPLGAVNVSDPRFWDLRLTDPERNRASALLSVPQDQYLAASVGTKQNVKDWGEENWSRLLSLLSRVMPEVTLILIGAADERARSQRLSRAWAGHVLNFCGDLSPRASAAILERCRLFIGHDSGPMHLSAAVGTPTLALFSWFNPPGQWFPGHRSWKFVKPLYPSLPGDGWKPELQMRRGVNEGIQKLQAEDVFRATIELWNEHPNPPVFKRKQRMPQAVIP